VAEGKGDFGYNAKTEDMLKAGIIDPTKVTRVALKCCISCRNDLTTECADYQRGKQVAVQWVAVCQNDVKSKKTYYKKSVSFITRRIFCLFLYQTALKIIRVAIESATLHKKWSLTLIVI
jgi:hypothetical protein